MNNLKRVLSLGLSGVMLSGMMAMGAGAADFTDADEIQHKDAVNVLVALNVVNGKEDGSFFDPTGDVTRSQMAKMIAVAMNGGTDANTGVKGTPSFTDIQGHWAESYIEYCYDLGIISGRGDGTFDPDGNVTGLEATKMVLTALGYDSSAYRLTGSSWAVRTDELARAADPSLYENLTGVVMANKATREVAAQIIWNGMQNMTKRVTPSTNTSTGEVTWSYGDGKGTLLKERYDANVAVGSFDGTYDVTGAGEEGEITFTTTEDVKDANGSVILPAGTKMTFPADFDIANIGEEAKVIWKDGNKGTKNKADKNDTIYGVFLTGATQTLYTTKAGIKSTADYSEAGKIKVDGVEYDVVAATGTSATAVVTDYGISSKTVATAGAHYTTREAAFQALASSQNPDVVKFVFDDNGKVEKAYVTTFSIQRVTGVTASKITLSSFGAIEFDGNDIYDGIEKDDVVVVTRFYSTDKDDAFFTVTKAETIEGEVNGYKTNENVKVDGETYKIASKTLADVTDDEITSLASGNIGDEVRLYMINDYVGAIQSLEVSDKNWAVVTDSSIGTLTSSLDPIRVTVMHTDGEEETLAVHEDSTTDGSTAVKVDGSSDNVKVGYLVQYTMNGGKIKIVKAIEPDGSVGAGSKVYNKETKKVHNGTNTYVAAADAVVYVVVNDDGNAAQITNGDDFYAYDLRDLNNISGGTNVKVGVALNDNKQAEVVVVSLEQKPTGATSNRVYGIVTSVDGTSKIDDEAYNVYTVSSEGEEYTINIPTTETLKKGDIVTFEQTNDDCYDSNKVQLFTAAYADDLTYAAANGYNAGKNLLTYYTSTESIGDGVYGGAGDVVSATTDDDVVIVYVDTDEVTSYDAGSINKFDITTGKMNILFKTNSDGLVDVIIVETSGEGFSTGKSTSVASKDDALALADGLYVPTVDFTGDMKGDEEHTILVKFTSSTKSSSATIWLAIDGTSDTVSCTTDANGNGYFIFNTKTNRIATGTHTIEVREASNSGTILFTGIFEALA